MVIIEGIINEYFFLFTNKNIYRQVVVTDKCSYFIYRQIYLSIRLYVQLLT